MKVYFGAAVLFLSLLHIASALIISDIQANTLSPGKEGTLVVKVLNDLDEDIEDVSFSLDLSTLPMSTIGSSEDSVDKIREDRVQTFAFTLRAASTAKPGDYNVPYTVLYKGISVPKRGTIGVKIIAQPDIDVTTTVDNPVIGEKGKISVKMINKGRGEANFVSLTLSPSGYTLLSEDSAYIGTINSDDFETASFDVIFTNARARLSGVLEYENQENQKVMRTLDIPLMLYTKERAIELGIKKKNNTPLYIGIIIALILLWLIWRTIKKHRRFRRSAQGK